jgi:hypothetical protein
MARAAAAAACVLAACAAAAPVTLRLSVLARADWPDPQALRSDAARVAGVPVEVAAIAPRRYALSLTCPDERTCAEARQRLQGSTLFAEVADDTRERVPAPPPPSTTR